MAIVSNGEHRIAGLPSHTAAVICCRTAMRVLPAAVVFTSRRRQTQRLPLQLANTFKHLNAAWARWTIAGIFPNSAVPPRSNRGGDSASLLVEAASLASAASYAPSESFQQAAALRSLAAANALCDHAERVDPSLKGFALELSEQVAHDIDLVEAHSTTEIVLRVPLNDVRAPLNDAAWAEFKHALEHSLGGWDVWVEWYGARRSGQRPDQNIELKRSRASMMPVEGNAVGVWNEYIRRSVDAAANDQQAEGEHVLAGGESTSALAAVQPHVPLPRPAAIRPIIQSGRLTIQKKLVSTSLSPAGINAALRVLRDQLNDLIAVMQVDANIDGRIVQHLEEVVARIPAKRPTQEVLFRIAHDSEVLAAYVGVATREWPDPLAARYTAFALSFERTMRQFPAWRAFMENSEKDRLSGEQIQAVPAMTRGIAQTLRDEAVATHIDPVIPEYLDTMAQTITDKLSESELPAGAEALAADAIESVNNIAKLIVGSVLRPGRKVLQEVVEANVGYASAMWKGYKNGLIGRGSKRGDTLAGWQDHLFGAIVSVIGLQTAAFATPLPEMYPHAFGWLPAVIAFLGGTATLALISRFNKDR